MIRKATLLFALLAFTVVATAPGAAATKTAKASRQNISLSISSMSPQPATSRADVIKFTGTLRNNGSTPMNGLSVRLRYSPQKFPDRATMAAYESDPAALPPNVSPTSRFDVQALAAGAQVTWEFIATPAQLTYPAVPSFGVYPVAVEVSQFNVAITPAQRTYVTYAPPTVPKLPRNKLAIALPVIDQPHRATDNPLFLDDKLSQSVTGKGRLADLARIAQAAPKNVSWFVEPGLLDDLTAMSKAKYQVKTKDGVQDRPASAEATSWLTTMGTALAASPVFAVPYADPDVAALAHQGLDAQPGKAIALGKQKLASLLRREVKTNVNWPPAGVLDADALDLLSVSTDKVDKVLLNPTNLPPQPPVPFTPDAAATLDSVNGPVTALMADAGLSKLFEPAAGTSTLLSTQRFIAETAMIAAEPGQTSPRSIVIAPSRRWDPNPKLVTELMKTATKLPWLKLTPIDSLKPTRLAVPRAGLTYTDQDRKDELTGKYLTPVKEVTSEAQLTSLITESKAPSAFDAAVLRLTSSAWRNNTRVGRSAYKLVNAAVTAQIDMIKITGSGPNRTRTLAGSSGVIPISVKNELGVPIALHIDVTSNNPELLQVNFPPKQEPMTIGPRQSGMVQVPMNAAPGTSGDATVTVQLKTADGQPYGEPQRLTIRTTGYTGIASVIVGAALTVMLAAVVTRVLRRRSERKLARAAKTRESESV
ncbi:DUF6049 family protein [Nonomuraea sp. NPDC050786]|uniref:DUF6049 family protein n=1 Tax=Nonomuraea sp. NPDC050786 TaxID=3154840 RepID=UPI0033E890C5